MLSRITTNHGALCCLVAPSAARSPVAMLTPAQIRASVRWDVIVSFEGGRQYNMLRRHMP